VDVHKEAIVIAVLNGSGKLVMETILETKASSIVHFLHGLRSELHVRSGPSRRFQESPIHFAVAQAWVGTSMMTVCFHGYEKFFKPSYFPSQK